MSDQQEQTKAYFSSHSDDWHSKVQDSGEEQLNTLRQRYACVEMDSGLAGEISRFLDIGCGTGELCLLMANKGGATVGIDIAPEMVEIAERQAKEAGVADRCSFQVGSALDLSLDGSYDMVASTGLIEYLALDETKAFFRTVHGLLRPGGTFAVESRNRLFNLSTFNSYSRKELGAGHLGAMMEEAFLVHDAADQSDLMAALASHDGSVPFLESYPRDGIPVSVRHQYTPAQLHGLLADAGLEPVTVRGYHYHAAPPAFLIDNGRLHAAIATEMQPHIPDAPALLLHCSSMVFHARRPS